MSAELISATSFAASEAEIKQRIETLRSAGYTQFTIQLVPGHEHALADRARIGKSVRLISSRPSVAGFGPVYGRSPA